MAIALAPAAVEGAEAVGARASAGAAAKKAAPKKVNVPEPKKTPGKEPKKPGKDEIFGGGGGKKKSGPSIGKKFVGKIGGKNLLIAELTTCLVILVFGTIVAPQGSKDGVPRLMVKGTALLAVFFVLAIVSTGGKGPQKVASSLGLLITLSYILTSSDMHDIFSWVGKFFTKPKQTNEVRSDLNAPVTESGS